MEFDFDQICLDVWVWQQGLFLALEQLWRGVGATLSGFGCGAEGGVTGKQSEGAAKPRYRVIIHSLIAYKL